MSREHAGIHWARRRAGIDPRLPVRLTLAERADLHHELDTALRGCAWCLPDRLHRLAEKAAALQAARQAEWRKADVLTDAA